jgi:hypothetical protein
MNESAKEVIKNEFFIIKDVEKFIPGMKPYTIRQLIKQGSIRCNMAGNKYVLNLKWVMEDLDKLATQNMKPHESENNSYGQLRKIF